MMIQHMTALYVIILSLFCVTFTLASICSFPDPDVNFTNEKYLGEWFEIGKIQTKGGGFFEQDCVCTELNISPKNESTGEYYADNDCRSLTVDGPWTNMTGLLYNEDLSKPGKWLENFGYGDVNYTVIAIQEDEYSVEYDCTTSALGVTNYCIHVLSRSRTMDQDLFDSLIEKAENMGLNPNGLPVQMTTQVGC